MKFLMVSTDYRLFVDTFNSILWPIWNDSEGLIESEKFTHSNKIFKNKVSIIYAVFLKLQIPIELMASTNSHCEKTSFSLIVSFKWTGN